MKEYFRVSESFGGNEVRFIGLGRFGVDVMERVQGRVRWGWWW